MVLGCFLFLAFRVFFLSVLFFGSFLECFFRVVCFCWFFVRFSGGSFQKKQVMNLSTCGTGKN